MPHLNTLTPKQHPFRIVFGQKALTHYKDYRKAIKVELLNPEPKEQMMRRIYQFVRATWADTPEQNANPTEEQMSEGLTAMLSGKSLGLGLEATNLTFKISGISRVDLQQIVRQRIGVVYSVQCTGDRDLRHSEILVEESIAKNASNLTSFIDAINLTKSSYVAMVDSQGVSIQAARLVLPEAREGFMFMNTNLSTLMFFHQKRIDDGSQTWEINQIAQKMADAVCEVYPELAGVFEKNKTKFKFQREASADRKNTFSTGLYLPKVDDYDYHERDVLYPMTKEQMHFTNTPIEDTYYWGLMKLSKKQYDLVQNKYAENNKKIHSNCPPNEEILKMNRQTNSELSNLFLKQNDEQPTN